eukprot:TRINITY_DN6927_c0_g1_i1.p1 TRINITY_DN6927_c0_g1~~TRINITY_DN6927_c0_g1_i1.p1  ORF type:complete len:559 (-),score=122.82 TRINITY_DN6927_c0_g1_i1:311-1987(-)
MSTTNVGDEIGLQEMADRFALSVQQVKDLHAVFGAIDLDHSGTIEVRELKEYLQSCLPAMPDEEWKTYFSTIDRDHDDKVSFEDFVAMLQPSMDAPAPKKATRPIRLQAGHYPVPTIDVFGPYTPRPNPLGSNPTQWQYSNFVTDEHRISANVVSVGDRPIDEPVTFVRAGPRSEIAWDPAEVRAAIVTCGGLCPGLNSVIRELVYFLWNSYRVRKIYGVRYGYFGFYGKDLVELTPATVSDIHHDGGTVLGSSRGGFDLDKIMNSIVKHGINQVYCIGGDGTHRGTQVLYEETVKRGLRVSVVGIPKTIDNDFQLIDKSFGFDTAIEEAQRAIRTAKVEASACLNGIGLVKLMGRQSGFIAMHATLASRDVDVCLIPEMDFNLQTLLLHLKNRLLSSEEASLVIVVAEGAGADILPPTDKKDASGNPVLPDIGYYLKDQILSFFKREGMSVSLKYIDPTYMIRSVAANSSDQIVCSMLAQAAVNGAMHGFTGFTAGLVNGHFCYIPISLVISEPKQVDCTARVWWRLLDSTRQPDFSTRCNIILALTQSVHNTLKHK